MVHYSLAEKSTFFLLYTILIANSITMVSLALSAVVLPITWTFLSGLITLYCDGRTGFWRKTLETLTKSSVVFMVLSILVGIGIYLYENGHLSFLLENF
jgi:hypothetical protein